MRAAARAMLSIPRRGCQRLRFFLVGLSAPTGLVSGVAPDKETADFAVSLFESLIARLAVASLMPCWAVAPAVGGLSACIAAIMAAPGERLGAVVSSATSCGCSRQEIGDSFGTLSTNVTVALGGDNLVT